MSNVWQLGEEVQRQIAQDLNTEPEQPQPELSLADLPDARRDQPSTSRPHQEMEGDVEIISEYIPLSQTAPGYPANQPVVKQWDVNLSRSYHPQGPHYPSTIYPEMQRRVRPALQPPPPQWYGNLRPGSRVQIIYHAMGEMEEGGPEVAFVQVVENRIEDNRWGSTVIPHPNGVGHTLWLKGQPQAFDLSQVGQYLGDTTERVHRFFNVRHPRPY